MKHVKALWSFIRRQLEAPAQEYSSELIPIPVPTAGAVRSMRFKQRGYVRRQASGSRPW